MTQKPQSSFFKHWPRKILHIDMDAFFAAVEQRDNPALRGKPVIVGGDPKSRGVVSTCSYEARKFGVRSAMSSSHAFRLCPEGIFVRPSFKKYSAASEMIHSIFHHYTDLVESVSLDEAYLDVGVNKLNLDDPVMIAKLIKQHILGATKLTASAGISVNLFLAKVASDLEKPNGLTIIGPEKIENLMKNLPVRKIPGVGPKTEKQLLELGLQTCGDIQKTGLRKLVSLFGNSGPWLLARAKGEDDREVEPFHERKQISVETTFEKDTKDLRLLQATLEEFSREVFHDLVHSEKEAKTITLKVKYFDFDQITRSKTLTAPIQSAEKIAQTALDLLKTKTEAGKKLIRLVGLGVSGFSEPEQASTGQLELFK
ncbi:MAG TPA: DNA polymerase IV [Candidatus Omnitrophota bacterium]|nr:DNA polymerase IV [Candidatus Omnitrophota bacterium]